MAQKAEADDIVIGRPPENPMLDHILLGTSGAPTFEKKQGNYSG